jgi:hypothetical protein
MAQLNGFWCLAGQGKRVLTGRSQEGKIANLIGCNLFSLIESRRNGFLLAKAQWGAWAKSLRNAIATGLLAPSFEVYSLSLNFWPK